VVIRGPRLCRRSSLQEHLMYDVPAPLATPIDTPAYVYAVDPHVHVAMQSQPA
jgi:hypothetical protein